MSQENNGKDRQLVVLHCNHSINNGTIPQSPSGFNVKFVTLPCTSKVEAYYILKTLAEGADGIELVTCPDKKCKMLLGSERAEKRIEYAQRILAEIGIGADRIGISRGESLMSDEIRRIVENRAAAVRALGPSPMKGN